MKKFKTLNNLDLTKFTGGSVWSNYFFKNPFKK